MKKEHENARIHFRNEWLTRQAWAKKVEGGFMPMLGEEEANPRPVADEAAAIEIAEKRKNDLMDAWK